MDCATTFIERSFEDVASQVEIAFPSRLRPETIWRKGSWRIPTSSPESGSSKTSSFPDLCSKRKTEAGCALPWMSCEEICETKT